MASPPGGYTGRYFFLWGRGAELKGKGVGSGTLRNTSVQDGEVCKTRGEAQTQREQSSRRRGRQGGGTGGRGKTEGDGGGRASASAFDHKELVAQ